MNDDLEALDFGNLLQRLRLGRAISQEVLAELSALSVQSISSLERGVRRAPYRHTVDALATALELDPDSRAALVRAAIRPRGPRTATVRLLEGPRFPAYPTNFIGRARESAELGALLDRSRLVVVCGFGGVGKTRLAIEVASRPGASRGRAYFIDFSTIREPQLVASRLAALLKLAVPPGDDELDALVAALAPFEAVLVLDNCETVIEECARVVEALLRGCPQLRVLATSREPLDIDGEALYRLEPLDPAAAAVDLFCDRVIATRAGNDAPPDRAVSAAIAAKLDGIPLALELAAALARTRHLDDILHSLSSAEFLTVAQRRTTVEHHRTMHAAIAWSYDGLSAQEQHDLRLIAYLPAGATRAGALAIAARGSDANLRRLVDASLVIEDRVRGRYTLHEVTRQFASALRSPAETANAADRSARYLGAAFDAAFERGWLTVCADPTEPFVPLVAEIDNVRQAFAHALNSRDPGLALGLVGGPDYWTIVSRLPEGLMWFERVRELVGDADDDPRSAALYFGLMMCAIQSGRAQEALAYAPRATALGTRHGRKLIVGRALIVLGHVALQRGDAEAAERGFTRASDGFAEIGSETGRLRARIFLGFAHVELGNADAAERIARDHERVYRERFGELAPGERCFVEILFTEVARLRGDLAEEVERARAAYRTFFGGPITTITARAAHNWVDVLVRSGEIDEALDVARVELRDFTERGFATEAALLLEICAAIFLRRGAPAAAARVAAYADAVLARAHRTRLRFAAELAAGLHAEIAALVPPDERERIARAAVTDRVADVIDFAVPEPELYE